MPLKLDSKDLLPLGHRLLSEGPHKTHATPRRVRILFNSIWIADTTEALFVWEHAGYPYFYLPWASFKQDGEVVKWEMLQREGEKGGKIATWKLSATNTAGTTKSTDRILSFQCDNSSESPAAALAGKVRVEFSAVDEWFEEDTPIHLHPKDPFKRIDLLPSTRSLKFSVPLPSDPAKTVTLAETPTAIHLHETLLPTRYYFPITALPQHMIRPSAKGTTTQCPYKGEAGYYDVLLPDGSVLDDIIWYYAFGRTTPECGSLAGTCCFYNEKVDVEIDGRMEERPKSFWS